MTTPFHAPYFEPYAYSEPYPWVAGPEYGYEEWGDEMTGFDPIWLTYPTFIGPPLIAAKKLGLLDSDDDESATRAPSKEARHGLPVQPSGGGGGGGGGGWSGDDSGGDRSGDGGRHHRRHKRSETDWTTYAWIGAGVLGAGLVIALIIPRGGK